MREIGSNRIEHLKEEYAVSEDFKERKDIYLIAAVVCAGGFPNRPSAPYLSRQAAFQIGEDIKEMIQLMPESIHYNEEWKPFSQMGPLATACFNHAPIEIIKILVDAGAVHSEVEFDGKIMSLVEAMYCRQKLLHTGPASTRHYRG